MKRFCIRCGCQFSPKTHRRIYCSPRCAQYAWHERRGRMIVPGRKGGRPPKIGGSIPIDRKLRRILRNAKGRCEIPSTNKFEYYGGRGIKCLLTFDDLKFLWQRDDADSLTQPSLDRLDSCSHYTVDNCRFIELAENRGRRSLNYRDRRS